MDDTIRVTVMSVDIPPMSTLGYGRGYDEQGRLVHFTGDHRSMHIIGEALEAHNETREPTFADVPTYCILDIRTGPVVEEERQN